MKAFVDRLVVFNGPEGRPMVKGKAALLVSAWEEQGMTAAEPMVRLFELSFRHLELRFEGSLLYDDMGPKDASRERGGALESARALGRSLGLEAVSLETVSVATPPVHGVDSAQR